MHCEGENFFSAFNGIRTLVLCAKNRSVSLRSRSLSYYYFIFIYLYLFSKLVENIKISLSESLICVVDSKFNGRLIRFFFLCGDATHSGYQLSREFSRFQVKKCLTRWGGGAESMTTKVILHRSTTGWRLAAWRNIRFNACERLFPLESRKTHGIIYGRQKILWKWREKHYSTSPRRHQQGRKWPRHPESKTCRNWAERPPEQRCPGWGGGGGSFLLPGRFMENILRHLSRGYQFSVLGKGACFPEKWPKVNDVFEVSMKIKPKQIGLKRMGK